MPIPTDEPEDFSRYQIVSRREIVSLLRNAGSRNQLIRMQTSQGGDSAVTSILHVDDAANIVVIDCASSALANQRILEGGEVSFETVLDNIRILFSAPGVESCIFEDRPALSIAVPASVVRLQRRESYRIMAPVSKPVYCTIRIPAEDGKEASTVTVPLHNVSIGGISVVDEKKLIPHHIHATYENCRIDLPGGAVTVTLQLRNMREVTLANGKSIFRAGFMFIDPSNAVTAAVQRFIIRLERDQNARASGMMR